MELMRMNSAGSAVENLRRSNQIRIIFNEIDINKDGRVNRHELGMAVNTHGILIPEHVRDILFERGDTDSDGTISFEEFSRLVDDPDMRPFFQKFFNIPPMSKIKNTAMSYWNECKWMPPPIMNLIIIVVQIIIYIFDNNDKKLRSCLEFQPSNNKEIWRYYTYSLIHENWAHLLGNSLVQLFFGTALEPVHGHKVVLLFIIGVFSGSLLHSIWNHGSTLIGASGGASALILAWVSDVVLNFGEQSCPLLSLIPVVIFILWQWLMTPGMTSVPAHLSGGITGLLFGFIVLKNIKEHQFERKVTKVALILGILYIGSLILLNVLNVHT